MRSRRRVIHLSECLSATRQTSVTVLPASRISDRFPSLIRVFGWQISGFVRSVISLHHFPNQLRVFGALVPIRREILEAYRYGVAVCSANEEADERCHWNQDGQENPESLIDGECRAGDQASAQAPQQCSPQRTFPSRFLGHSPQMGIGIERVVLTRSMPSVSRKIHKLSWRIWTGIVSSVGPPQSAQQSGRQMSSVRMMNQTLR
jgi:hypothetical protein